MSNARSAMEVKFHPEVKEDLSSSHLSFEAAERGPGHGFIEDCRKFNGSRKWHVCSGLS